MEDTSDLAAHLVTAWYEKLFDSGKWRIGEHVYELAPEEDYTALGEDPEADDAPLIFKRDSDGAFFEITLDVIVSGTTPEGRAEDRAYLRDTVNRAGRPKTGEPSG